MTLIVKAARIVWDADETAISDGQVVIDQDRIREVHSAAARPADEVADVIDLGSATIVPGLIDSHGHISNNTSYRESLAVQNQVDLMVATLRGVANLRDDLRTGVTTMRTLGGPDKLEVRFRDAIAANQVDGPRLQIAIRLFRPTHGTAAFVGTTADGPDELRFRIRETFFFGADWIKLLITNVMHGETMRDYLLGDLTTVPSYNRAEIEAAIDEAHTLGMKVTAHAMGGPALRWAIEAGIDSIEHGNMLEDDDVELFAKHGTYLSDPNLQLKFDSDEIKAKRSHGLPAEEWWRDKIAASAAHWRRAIPRLLDAGVKICLGVDSSHGNLWREAGHLYDLGATPAQALGAVTKNGAALLGLSDQVGALRPGMRADLVGIDGDPLTDPWCLGRVTFVMKDGRVVWQSGQRPDAMLSPVG